MPSINNKSAAEAAISKAVHKYNIDTQDKVLVWKLCQRLIHYVDVIKTGATPNPNRMSLVISTGCPKPEGMKRSRRRVKKGCNARYIEDVIKVLVNEYTPHFLSDWDDVARAIKDCTIVDTETTVNTSADYPWSQTETKMENVVDYTQSYVEPEKTEAQSEPAFTNQQIEKLNRFESDLDHQLRMIQLSYEIANITCRNADQKNRDALSIRFIKIRDEFIRKCLERIN
jgi:hypothetical protein